MYSNPHVRQPLQSEDDSFQVSESLGRLRLDEPADVNTNPSTPPKSTLPSTQLNVSISDEALQALGEELEPNIQSSYDNTRLQRSLKYVWVAVHNALENDPDLSTCRASQKEFLQNLKERGEQQFFDLLRDVAERKSWRDLLQSSVFVKQIPPKERDPTKLKWSEASMSASVHAWVATFQGEAAEVLLDTIANYLDKQREGVYSRHTSIVNSSGTGKSRIVDEVATRIITVPMCLRNEGTQGFPPPDIDLRGWLTSVVTMNLNNQGAVAQKLHGFMASLLIVLRRRLEAIASGGYDIPKAPLSFDLQDEASHKSLVQERQALLASAFRKLMTSDTSFQCHNEYRQYFYKEVIELADAWVKGSHIAPGLNADSPPQYKNEEHGSVNETGERLSKFIDPQGILDLDKGSRWPLVILAFDESHVLTDNPKDRSWTLFSELRRTLREIVDWPIFSLFLSTAGSFHHFSPEIKSDHSSRVTNAVLLPLDPISEISFDDLAFSAKEGTVSLDRVVQTDWMSHLGRPLFGAYHDVLQNENELMLFAKEKLLNGRSRLVDGDGPGSLACLSVRFALEFNADSISRDVTCKQVERHMRLCLAATTGFSRLITLAGSEPLLAEAAWQLMRDSSAKPVRHLAEHSDLHCIDRGRRGELVAALLVMQARDAAVATQMKRDKLHGRERPQGQRAVSIGDFMQALLPQSSYKTLLSSMPTLWLPGENRPFDETFKDYAMWFNHVIRIEDPKMIKADYLWAFITRGAMVLCTHNQYGVDIVLPLCLNEGNLSRHTVSAILIQVKNDEKYGYNIDKTLFDGLNPTQVGLFENGSPQRPVIRMVFALASKKYDVLFPDVRERDRGRFLDDCTTFDIWCAGLSCFNNIEGDLTSYQVLLDRSLQPHDAFKFGELKDKYLDPATRASRGRRRRRMAALTMADDDHRQIYL